MDRKRFLPQPTVHKIVRDTQEIFTPAINGQIPRITRYLVAWPSIHSTSTMSNSEPKSKVTRLFERILKKSNECALGCYYGSAKEIGCGNSVLCAFQERWSKFFDKLNRCIPVECAGHGEEHEMAGDIVDEIVDLEDRLKQGETISFDESTLRFSYFPTKKYKFSKNSNSSIRFASETDTSPQNTARTLPDSIPSIDTSAQTLYTTASSDADKDPMWKLTVGLSISLGALFIAAIVITVMFARKRLRKRSNSHSFGVDHLQELEGSRRIESCGISVELHAEKTGTEVEEMESCEIYEAPETGTRNGKVLESGV
ncbi:hypothetical protein BJ508DRAFT_69238 [Ascobolus immersus RN42]|uniref:Uncharacterized protein n=1 Tax=Ascobolus immersus RN42 TaxID=1160509 RepID=A0A3N4HL94_ASCIM|nr:hypothetical protein BJ508DRAFT_69238 [Ascobolus immersus RN42]